jgi:hypothetical protein
MPARYARTPRPTYVSTNQAHHRHSEPLPLPQAEGVDRLQSENTMDHGRLKAAQPINRDQLVNAVLDLEFPNRHFVNSLAHAVQAFAQNKPQSSVALFEQPGVAERREALKTVAIEDLQQLKAKLTARKAQREEAARFYNEPQARADFAHWLSMDFWTLDEAVALLLGRNPAEVNKTSIAQDLAAPKSLLKGPTKPPTAFTKLFMALQLSTERSNVMTASAKLSPREVVRWGQTQLGRHLPPQLLTLLEDPNAHSEPLALPEQMGTAPAPSAVATPEEEVVLVKRKALTARRGSWPTVESDLRNSGANGLGAAAKAEDHGMWKEKEALEWARRQGKLTGDSATPSPSGLGQIFHRIATR